MASEEEIEEIGEIIYNAFASYDNYDESQHLEELGALCDFALLNIPPKQHPQNPPDKPIQ